MNGKVYQNAFECYSDCYLMWVVSLKKRNDILTLMRKKGFVMVIVTFSFPSNSLYSMTHPSFL